MNPAAVTPLEPDPALEVSLRPPMFSEFTGQVKVCERLEVLVQAAKQRGDVLEHILLERAARAWARPRWPTSSPTPWA